jgi:Ankyrin repeats (3 copies)
VKAGGERKEKELFDSCCVTNDVETAQSIIERSKNQEVLINEVTTSGGPILLAACEEGHLEVVHFLLKHNPHLEATNESGKTALTTSISNGYGRIACMLIRAGARMGVVNIDGQTLLDLSRHALERHEDFRRLELHPVYADSVATQTRLPKLELEISAFRDIIEECEIQEGKRLAERKRQRLVRLHGEYQANRFIETKSFDQAEIISEMLRKMARTPRPSEWKTIACLARGIVLPYTLAVSGYSDGPFGSHDGALDRPTWTQKVFQLADLLEHELPRDPHDKEGRPGSFYACHAEKQALSFMLWNHTTALGDVDEAAQLDCFEAPALSRLHAEIFVWQPARKQPYVCPDCSKFCAKAAQRFNMSLSLLLVHESDVELTLSWPWLTARLDVGSTRLAAGSKERSSWR